MTKKIFLALTALAALTLSFSSCKEDNKGKTPTDVKLVVKPESVTVMAGKTVALEIKTQPANAEYTCVSKDSAIATVDAKGVITGVKVGETTVSVTAGTTTKNVTVKVTDPNSTDESRLLGKVLPEGMEKLRDLIAPIYAPIFSQMKAQEDIVKAANTKEGWKFFLYTGKKEYLNKSIYTCSAPKNGDDYADERLVSQVVYEHTPEQGSPNMTFFFKDIENTTVFDEDPIKLPKEGEELTDEEAKRMNIFLSILKAYGFDGQLTRITFSDADFIGVGYFKKGLEGGSLLGYIYAPKWEDGKHHLILAIEQQEPQQQNSATRMTTMTRAFYPEVLRK